MKMNYYKLQIMKKLYYLSFCFFSIASFAQVTIGDPTKASADKTSVLLDFERTNNKGLLLPSVNSVSGITDNGTIVLDATAATSAQFKVKKNTGWFNYSRNNGNATSITSSRPTKNDNINTKVIIGSETSPAKGALILESTTKAMVLPVVSSVDNIINPSPGMMVFVNKESCTNYDKPCVDQYLAFFNGTEWSFWESKS